MLTDRSKFFAAIRASEFGNTLQQSQVDGFNVLLDAIPTFWDIRWAAYLLATVIWETKMTMQPVREAFWLSEDWRKAHLRYYPYYGRGYCQLTWLANYQKFSPIIGVDLVKFPDLAMVPANAAKIIVYGMERGSFSGHALPEYFPPGVTDWILARRIINGLDRAEEVAAIAQECYKALTA